MAEKIVLAEIDIDTKGAIEETVRLREETKKLKAAADAYKGTEQENTAEHVKAQAAYKVSASELSNQEKLVTKLTAAQNTNTGTLQKLEAENAKLREAQKKLDLTTEEGIKLNEKYNDRINKNTETIKGNVDQRKKEIMNIGNYPGAFGKMSEAVTSTVPAFGKASAAAKAFLANPIGLILTAIVAVVGLLVKAFSRSEESMNKIKTVTGALSGVFNGFLKILKPVVGFIADVVVATFENLGKIAEKTLALVSKGLSMLGFDKAAKAVSDFSDNMKSAAKAGMELAMMEAELQKSQRQATKIQLDYQKQAEKLRQIRDDESKSIAERIAANEKLGQVLKDQASAELAIAAQGVAIAQKRIQLEGESTENLDALAEAQTRVSDIQERITGQESEQLANLNSLRKESSDKEIANKQAEIEAAKLAADEKRKLAEEAVATMEYELNMWRLNNKSKLDNSQELNQQIIDAEKQRLDSETAQQEAILQTQLESKLISQQEYNLQVATLESQKNETIAALNQQFHDEQQALKLEALAIDYENEKILLNDNLLAQFDIEKAAMDKMQAEEIKAAQKTGASIELINKKYAKAAKAIEREKFNANLSLAYQFSANIATIAGENTKVGKAAASAATAINTYQAAMGSYSALASIPYVGPILGIAAAGAAVVAGIANIRKIWAVSPDGVGSVTDTASSGGSGATGTSGSSSPVSALTTVNTDIGAGIVSRNTEVNQQTQTNQPVLVVDEVTNAQTTQQNTKVNASV